MKHQRGVAGGSQLSMYLKFLKRYNAYLKRLKDRVDSGALKPIHMHIFDGLEEGSPQKVRLGRR